MSRQLHTLFMLNNKMVNLDFAQEIIDEARFTKFIDTPWQEQLDRQQEELNQRRDCLLRVYYEISSTN